MSKGPGVQQRRILATLEEHEQMWVTDSTMTAGQRAAALRAARTLAERGLIVLASAYDENRRACMVAVRPGAPIPNTIWFLRAPGRPRRATPHRKGGYVDTPGKNYPYPLPGGDQ